MYGYYMENRSPLPGASIPIVPLSQPCPVSFYYFRTEICGGFFNFPRKHVDVRITPKNKWRPKAKADLYSFSAGDVNSRGPQLSYDWL